MSGGGAAMSTVPKRLLTPEEYLTIERAAKFKSEYFAGEMYAMAGATWEHTLIKDNLARETGNQLKNGPCRALTSDLRVKVSPTGLFTYPDLVVVCGEPEFADAEFDTLLNPTVVAEVLSESSEGYDRGTKFSHYRTLPTLREYLLVSQDRPLLERYVRQNDDWLLTEFVGLSKVFEYGTIPVRIPLKEIYDGVEFPPAALKPLWAGD
jgi:Uma2 family endonuclease